MNRPVIRPALAAAFAAAIVLASAPAVWAASASVGTGSVVVVIAKSTAPYRHIVIKNQSSTATVSCTDDGSTPAIGAAGSYDIPPGAALKWGDANVTFGGPITCIASAAATPVSYTAQ